MYVKNSCDKLLLVLGDGAIAGVMAEKYIAESEIFEKQIMIGDGVAYVYNAVEADQRAFVTKVQELREAHGDMAFHCVDIYKSEGMAKTLGC